MIEYNWNDGKFYVVWPKIELIEFVYLMDLGNIHWNWLCWFGIDEKSLK